VNDHNGSIKFEQNKIGAKVIIYLNKNVDWNINYRR
jgi:hypothetical protein